MQRKRIDAHALQTAHSKNMDPNHENSEERVMDETCAEKSYRFKLFLHSIICFSMFNYGWALGMKGPAFTDLIKIVGVSSGAGSVFVSTYFAGMLSGSILCGFVIDRYNQFLVLACASICSSCSTFATPLCSIYWSMILVNGIQGFGNGIILTGCFTVCGQLWTTGASARSFLQSVQLCLPVGAILSPLVVAPFLSTDLPIEVSFNKTQKLHAKNRTFTFSPSANYSSSVPVVRGYGVTASYSNQTANTDSVEIKEQRLIIPFSISGVMILVTAVMFMVMFCQYPALTSVEKKSKGSESNTVEQKQPMSLAVRIVRFYLIGQLGFLDKGAENSFVQFFPTFLHKKFGWTQVLSSDVMSVYWGPYAFSRLIGIAVSYHLKPTKHLLFDILLLIFSVSVLLLETRIGLDSLMWVTAASSGVAFSTVAPCVMSWSHSEILSRSGKHNSFLVVSCSMGSVVLPLIIGNMIEVDYVWYIYLLLTSSILLLVNYICLVTFARMKLGSKKNSDEMKIVDNGREETK